MACWFNSDDATLSQFLMGISSENDYAYHHFGLWADGSVAGDPIKADTYDGTSAVAASTSGFSANTWHHACAVWSATNARAAYIDGGSKGTDTTSCTPASLDNVTIAALYRWAGASNLVGASLMSGSIAEAAVWNAALTDAEVAMLALGLSPLLIRPANLAGYWPLIRDEDRDRAGDYHMTAYNTPSIATHPPKLKPWWLRPWTLRRAAAAPPATRRSQLMMLGVG